MSDKIFKALVFAVEAHTGQYRKQTPIPYVFHPVNVARLLIEHGYPEEIVIAGLLHDTIEDTKIRADDIREVFNENIASLVAGVSEMNKKDPWEVRKKETIEKMKSAPHDLLVLCCADKLDNIRAIKRDYKVLGEKLWERFNQPGEKQKWYFKELARVFGDRKGEFDSFPLAEEFIQEVNAMFP